jgi:hypothetical protein
MTQKTMSCLSQAANVTAAKVSAANDTAAKVTAANVTAAKVTAANDTHTATTARAMSSSFHNVMTDWHFIVYMHTHKYIDFMNVVPYILVIYIYIYIYIYV